MILFKRLIPFFVPVILIYCGAQLTASVEQWQKFLFIGAIVSIFAVWHLLQWQLLSLDRWWQAIPAFLWLISGYAFFIFMDQGLYQWILIIGLPIVFGLYLETLFTYLYQPHKYTNLLLPKFSQYLIILSSFFSFSSVFALVLINKFRLWEMFLAAFLYGLLTFAHVLRGFHLLERKYVMLILWFGLVVLQLTAVMYLLPTNYIVAGGVFGVFFYSVPSIIVMQLRDAVDKKQIFQYTLVAFGALIVTLVTAQWL